MKKRRSPQEKKELSLKKDRRSIFGANPEASRKGVRRSKRAANKTTRHNVKAALDLGLGTTDETNVESLEIAVVKSKRKIFKKVNDDSLRNHIDLQRKKREHRIKYGNGATEHLGIDDVPGSKQTPFEY